MTKSMFKLLRAASAPMSDQELLENLRRVALVLGSTRVSAKRYAAVGQFSATTFQLRFGSWNNALTMAGLEISNEQNLSDDKLFENILFLWQLKGRQPKRRELEHESSTISQSPYNRRFGSWTAALQAFVKFANDQEIEANQTAAILEKTHRRTARDPSLRLRWYVLQRDSFTCCACGASPAISRGVELHVDHRLPWSKGGETVRDNLQTLCSVCNLGKSNLLPDLN